ncbi:MAG: glycosyltransferase family 4 protein [Parcubacteria group bacterium]|jgi:glycosyltransferase involved in cell wall biosynthesis
MKLAYIGQKGIPAKIGGVERYVDEVAVRMAKKGHEVFVYVRDYYTPKNLKSYKGVKLVHIPTIKTKHLDAISHTLLSTIHALFQDYDVIHYHSLGPSTLSFIPKIFCGRTAVVSTYQSQDYEHHKWGFIARAYLRLGERIILNVPDKTISVTDHLRNIGLEKYGRDSLVIPNGVTVFKKASSLDVFKKWPLKKNKYALAVSRLVAHKEIHTLIQAFINLKAQEKIDKEFKLVVAGGGSYTDDYVRELKAMIRGRKDIVFAGVQRGEKLAALYKNAAFYAQPSRAEGLSLALLESMGMGLAPLVSDIPENLSAIHENGFVFRVGDTFDLMSKFEYLVNHPLKAKAMGEKARRMVKEEYNWDKIVDEIESVYHQVVLEKREKANAGKGKQFLAPRRGTWL